MTLVSDEAFRADTRFRRIPGRATCPFNFDVVPHSAKCVMAFILVNGNVTAWEYSFDKFHIERRPTVWSGEWRRQGTFAAPFEEPFHVAAAQGAYFFVTDSGVVYSADKTGGNWQTAVTWKDAARPVLAMLVQSDGATAFVFGKDFYFKVAKKPKPLSCRDVTKGAANLTEPARLVYECGRVLFEKGELKTGEANQ